jgi:hypothetical protein
MNTVAQVVIDPDWKPWPSGWPVYVAPESRLPCTAAIGGCSCGAWHGPGEFWYKNNMLYRHGRLVADNREIC